MLQPPPVNSCSCIRISVRKPFHARFQLQIAPTKLQTVCHSNQCRVSQRKCHLHVIKTMRWKEEKVNGRHQQPVHIQAAVLPLSSFTQKVTKKLGDRFWVNNAEKKKREREIKIQEKGWRNTQMEYKHSEGAVSGSCGSLCVSAGCHVV